MKPAYYFLAAVLLLVASLAAVVSIGTRARPRPAAKPALREVYVDLSAVVASHPVSPLLDTISGYGSFNAAVGRLSCRPFSPLQRPHTNGVMDVAARHQLEAASAQAAIVALSKLEELRREALDARVRLKRTQMTDRYTAEADPVLRDIERQRSAALKEAADSIALERINILLRIAGLRTQAAVPTLDQARVRAELVTQQGLLDALEDRHGALLRHVQDEFRAKIDEQSRAADAKVDEVLSAFDLQGRRRIESDIAQGRSSFLRDLSERNGSGVYEVVGGMSQSVPAVVVRERTRGVKRLNAPEDWPVLSTSLDVTRSAIRDSVARAVKTVAEQHGFKVTFQPDGMAPDATSIMLRLMRERAWGAVK